MRIGLLAAVCLFLAACGDDGEGERTPPEPTTTRTATATLVPPSVTSTTAPTPTATPGCIVCGDGRVEADEECDDGDDHGGDGCAANCTVEESIESRFEEGSGFEVYTTGNGGIFTLPLPVVGTRDLIVGRPRTSESCGTGGAILAAGDLPLVQRAVDLRIDPIPVSGLVCVCVRAVESSAFGPGIAGIGRLACGGGLPAVNYTCSIDHDIRDIDPFCTTGTPDPEDPERCVGPLRCEFADAGPRGSMTTDLIVALNFLMDGGTCATDPNDPEKGADGVPCTDDDPAPVYVNRVFETTGRAWATFVDGVLALPPPCTDPPCEGGAGVTGSLVDCEAFPERGFEGSRTALAIPVADMPFLGDTIITGRFGAAPAE